MPESDRSSPNSGGPPAGRRRTSAVRPLMLAFFAMVCGYYLSDAAKWLWRDTSGVEHTFETMNTHAVITVPEDSGTSLTPREAAGLAEEAARRVNDLMSPFGEHSDIRRLNETPPGQWVEVDPLTWTVVMEALRWHRLSEGAFDPSIGPVKRLFTFDQSETEDWPTEEALADARAKVGAEKLLFDREGMRLSWSAPGMRLDLGAIAKGFAVDRAAEVLIANGVKNALVNIGGELRILGHKPGNPPAPWRTGIHNPRGGGVVEKMELSDAAVATSGDYESFFVHKGVRYKHIIDPRTGLPMTGGPAGVTVIHPRSCLAADALATTMCVLGPEEGLEFLERQALGLFSGGVRVVMLIPDGDDRLVRHEFIVDDQGNVKTERTEVTSDA